MNETQSLLGKLCLIPRFLGSASRAIALCVSLLVVVPASAEDQSPPEDPVVEMEDFVVTGTRTERLVSEAPVKTERIVAEDMRSYNVTSFRDALKLIPTARFESDCQNCGLNQIQLMGLSTDYTAILFDGAPLYSGLARVYGANLFPAILIDRIEVVKGGSSVLYGPEAMAGVVNLITAEPSITGGEFFTLYNSILGDANEWEVSAIGDYVDPEGRFSISAYGYWRDREGLDLTTDGFTEIPEFENLVGGVQFWWHPIETGTARVTYQYMDQEHRGGDQLDVPVEQARVAEALAHEVHIAQVSWEQELGSSFDYYLGASYLYIERESFYGARGDNEQRAYEEAGLPGDVTEAFIANNQDAIDALARTVFGLTENHVFFAEAQLNQYLDSHTLSYGVQYRFEEVTEGSLFDSANTPTTVDDFANLGAFIQDQWAITRELELVPGLRIDKHDNVQDVIISPRLAARYRFNEELTVRASWSTGFNAPGAFNEDRHIGANNGGAIILINAPDLQEERSQTFSLGGEYSPLALDQQVVVHSQVHYTRLQDTFEIDDSGEVSGDENIWLRINGPDAQVWVWENNVSWQVNEHLRLDSGLSYVFARFDDPIERVTGLTTDEFLKRPEWTGHLGVAYENRDWFSVYGLVTYTGTMLATGEDADIWRETDPFYVVDLGISRDFDGVLGIDHFTIRVGIENLFDDRQEDLQDNGEERDVTYVYGPTQPRTYYIQANAVW